MGSQVRLPLASVSPNPFKKISAINYLAYRLSLFHAKKLGRGNVNIVAPPSVSTALQLLETELQPELDLARPSITRTDYSEVAVGGFAEVRIVLVLDEG